MSFETEETSNYSGRPITLYSFSVGTQSWHYNDTDRAITVSGTEYLGVPISHEGIIQSGDVGNDDFKITMPHNTEFTELFIGTPPSESIMVTVRRKQQNDSEAPVVWSGIGKSGRRKDSVSYTINCKPLLASLNRPGLRLSWGRTCPHALYDSSCRVDPTAFSVATTVNALTGVQITVLGLAVTPSNKGYQGGYIEFIHNGNGLLHRIGIEVQDGSRRLELLGTTDGLAVGQAVVCYQGCARTLSDCDSRFSNTQNYGGFPQLPSKSPFDGNPVF